jgi:hypothetical protein
MYLKEAGFPRRFLLEFSKWGDSIGDPVLEPGPGSNPIEEAPPDTPGQPIPPEAKSDAGSSSMEAGLTMPDGVTRMWESLGKLKYPLAGTALLGLAGWHDRSPQQASASEVDKALEASRSRSFTRGARLRRAWLRRVRRFPVLEPHHGDLSELPKRSE